MYKCKIIYINIYYTCAYVDKIQNSNKLPLPRPEGAYNACVDKGFRII